MGALLFLIRATTVNRLRARLRRLREPRYAAATAAGLLYFYMLYFRPSAGSDGSVAGTLSRGLEAGRTMETAGALLLFALAALLWTWPGARPALPFSRADVQLLFPAPLTRRQLVLYRILRSQVATIGAMGLLTIFALPSGLIRALTFFVGAVMACMIVNLHVMGVSLSRASLGQHGTEGLKRQWLPLLLLCAVVAAIGLTSWPLIEAPANVGAASQLLDRISAHGLAGIVLAPFRTVVRLALPGSAAEFLRQAPWGLLLVGLNLVWVLRSDAAFEEAADARAEQMARLSRGAQPAARRARGTLRILRLRPEGRPELALAWKNVVLLGRYSSLRALIFVAAVFGLAIGAPMFLLGDSSRAAESLELICLLGAMTAVFFGPHMVRNDLRRDLAHLALVKTWPVSSGTIVRGELLAPMALLSAAAWALILNAAQLASGATAAAGAADALPRGAPLVVSALTIVPAAIAPQLVVLNAIALTFPAWTSVGPGAHGVEVMGQRALLLLATLVALAAFFVPGILCAAVVGYAQHAATGSVSVPLAAAVTSAVVLGESALATAALGRLLDRTDLTAVGPAE